MLPSNKNQAIKNYYSELYKSENASCPQYRINNFQDMAQRLKCSEGQCGELNNSNYSYHFVPLAFPKHKADYIFICKEPSGGGKPTVNKPIGADFNFIPKDIRLSSFNVMVLAFIQTFPYKSIYVTDMSKCAMSTTEADGISVDLNTHRYYQCSDFLNWELTNLTTPGFKIIMVGTNLFFNIWYRNTARKNKQRVKKINYGKASVDFISSNGISIEYDKNKIFEIPHYAIRFSAPNLFLELMEDENKNFNRQKIKDELKDSLPKLYEYYLKNFCFSQDFIETINIQLQNKSYLNVDISDSKLFLYLLYKSRFKRIKQIVEEKN